MAEHMICVVAAQGCECATLCTISSAQAALGAMTDGEVGLVLLHRHTRDLNDDAWHRLCKDPELSPMEAETVDFLPRPSPHIFGLLAKKLGLWPPEVKSGE